MDQNSLVFGDRWQEPRNTVRELNSGMASWMKDWVRLYKANGHKMISYIGHLKQKKWEWNHTIKEELMENIGKLYNLVGKE